MEEMISHFNAKVSEAKLPSIIARFLFVCGITPLLIYCICRIVWPIENVVNFGGVDDKIWPNKRVEWKLEIATRNDATTFAMWKSSWNRASVKLGEKPFGATFNTNVPKENKTKSRANVAKQMTVQPPQTKDAPIHCLLRFIANALAVF